MPRISIVQVIPWALLIATQANAENVTELWVARFDGPGPAYYDGARAMAVDGDGSVYVTGLSADETRSGADGYDYATVKYDKRGAPLWVARCNGPSDLADEPSGIMVDREGNTYVTGRSKGEGGDFDYVTIKYDPQGNQAWVARYDGGQNLNDRARAMALDAHENVIVTGGVNDPIFDENSGRGYGTVKYDKDGNERWSRTYSANGRNALGRALAVDADGSIYVTGRHAIGQQGDDFLTIKYSANGAEEWTSRYEGPRGVDIAVAVALDSPGNVIVAGWSDGSNGPDYATIKYNPTGQQLWVARYDSGGEDILLSFVLLNKICPLSRYSHV